MGGLDGGFGVLEGGGGEVVEEMSCCGGVDGEGGFGGVGFIVYD